MASTFGTWRQLLHWGPLLALSVITMISIMTIHCTLMYWPPLQSLGGFVHMTVFLGWNFLTLFNFFKAVYAGPGFLHLGWKPDDDNNCKFLQYCKICEGYKAPRSHHCRKCDRCVMKMDHHCPWINTCVGHFNHGYFTYFLFWAVVGCLHAVSILCMCLYRALNRSYYIFYHRGEPLVSLTLYAFMGSMFAAGLAIGVIIAVGILLFIQLKSVITNKTGIEQWITEKAQRFDSKEPEFIYPYDLGWHANISQVLGVLSSLCVESGMPDGDGIWWPIRDGCTQFTLTIEQKAQKEEKRERSITYTIVEPYSGAFLPVSKGCRIVCSIPYTDEPRIPLKPGDEVSVTRWRRHWLYGEKRVKTDNSVLPPKGWFPRRCAVELTADDCDLSKLSKKYKKIN